jgi:prophage DNA circulation protein
MSTFSPKIEDSTEDQLSFIVNERDARYGAIVSSELLKRAVNKLQETIKTFNEQSSKQTEKMIKLTWGIVALTIVMVAGLVVQIILVL